jgi:hypothetical protein
MANKNSRKLFIPYTIHYQTMMKNFPIHFLFHKGIFTINVPRNFTAPCVIFSDCFFYITTAIRPMNRDFFGHRAIARAVRRVLFGAQKSRDSWTQFHDY